MEINESPIRYYNISIARFTGHIKNFIYSFKETTVFFWINMIEIRNNPAKLNYSFMYPILTNFGEIPPSRVEFQQNTTDSFRTHRKVYVFVHYVYIF
jgi:hypothetical protein